MAVVQSEGALLNAAPPWSPRIGTGSIQYASGLTADYAAIYRTQPNVRLVVHFLARNIASLELRPYRRIDDETVQPLERDHELSRTLRRPNPKTTRHRYVLALMHDLAIFDRFYSLKARIDAPSQSFRTYRIPPQNLRPKNDGSWLFPSTFETVGLRERKEYAADTMIYIHGHDPEDPRSGLSPIESIRRILIEDQAASEWREQLWRNGARHSGVIERPLDAPPWSSTARRRWREEFTADFAGLGPEAGGVPLLEEGMTWKDASFSAKDSEYLAARRLSREETAAQYHVSPLFVGILDHANFSNVSEQHKHLYADTLGPWLDMVEEDFELQLLPEFPDLNAEEIELRFNLDEKLRGSFEEEATILQTATGAPWLTRNEARGRRGLAPIEGGDALVVPLNVLVGGQASPRDSAPPPAGAAGRGPGHPVPRARARKAHELEVKLAPLAATKAADDLPNDVQGWHAKHEEILVPFFTRQGASVRSRYGASGSIEDAFDADRWNGELETDLAALAFTMAEEIGGAEADRLGSTFDLSVAEEWLRNNARIAAEKVNATTLAALVDELAALEDEEDPELTESDVLDAVFTVAAGARAAELALTRTTSISNFARQEGAQQAGAGSKTWTVNSSRSRHPELNGETVPIGETFSNGLLWPGDPSGSTADTAGCTCSLSIDA